MTEIRAAVRGLVKSPGFTGPALVALTLGIGANTAIFSVVDAVVLRSMPLRDPARVVTVWKTSRTERNGHGAVSRADVETLRQAGGAFEALGCFEPVSLQFRSGGEPESVAGARVSAELAMLLQIRPAVGRIFTASDENAALLGHDLWQRRFAGDPGVVGRSLAVEVGGLLTATARGAGSFTIVGVLPDGLRLPVVEKAALWIQMPKSPASAEMQASNVVAIGRLRGNARIEAARGLVDSRVDRLGWHVNPIPLAESLAGADLREPLLLLWAAAALVLLIACANLANLELVRWNRRRKEMAVRAALGAGGLRLTRLLLVESLILAVAGGFCGLIAGFWCVRLLGVSSLLPKSVDLRMNPALLAYAACVSLVAGLVFGLAPARMARRIDLASELKERGRTSRGAVRTWITAAEVALAFMLSVGAGLLIRSFTRLSTVDPGFDIENLATARISLPPSRYREPAQRAAFYRQVLDRLHGLPDVRAAAVVNFMPMAGADAGALFVVEGAPAPRPNEIPTASLRTVSPGYFRTLGIGILAGRDFTEQDLDRICAIVNEAFARKFWPGENAVGKHIHLGPPGSPGRWIEVAGVASNARQFGLDKAASPPMLFLPFLNSPVMSLMARGSVDTAVLAAAVRAVDSSLALQNPRTMRQAIDESLAHPRLRTRLLSAFALLALALAAVGIFGVTAFSVAQRTREIGIRLALGAEPAAVRRMVLRQGLMQAVCGIAAGAAGALALKGLLAHWLFGIAATDWAAFASAAAVSLAAVAAAVYVPARRAASVDPMRALREE
jgi:putative ABC transport system permease protein